MTLRGHHGLLFGGAGGGTPTGTLAGFFTDLVAWWDFEENDAEPFFLDSHGTNHLSITDQGSDRSRSSFASRATGKVGRGFETYGAGRAAIVPRSNTACDLDDASSFSLGGWVLGNNPGGSGGWTAFVMGRYGRMDGTTGPAALLISASVQFQMAVVDTGGTVRTVSATSVGPSASTPVLVVGTYNQPAGTIELRCRAAGSLESVSYTLPVNALRDHSTNNFAINHAAVSEDWKIVKDEQRHVAAYNTATSSYVDSAFVVNRAISDTEFNELWASGSGMDYEDLCTHVGVSYSAPSGVSATYDTSSTDALWSSVKFSLPLTGTHNATSATDVSTHGRAITFVNNAKIVTDMADPFGNTSGVLYLDGSGDVIHLPDSSDWSDMTSCCFEGWFKAQNPFTTGEAGRYGAIRNICGQAVSTGFNPFFLGVLANGALDSRFHANGSAPTGSQQTSTYGAPVLDWFHLAAQLDFANLSGGWPQVFFYLHGRLVHSGVVQLSSRHNPAAPFCIGNYSVDYNAGAGVNLSWKGWMSNLRYTSGSTPRYPNGTAFNPRNSAFPTS